MTTMTDIRTNYKDEYERLQNIVPRVFAVIMACGPVSILVGLALADNNVISLGLVLMLTGCAGVAVSY
jgi:hypothetical protein